MLYNLNNTVRINKPVDVIMNGEELLECIWAYTFLGFVLAIALRKDKDGNLVVMPGGEGIARKIHFGRGEVKYKVIDGEIMDPEPVVAWSGPVSDMFKPKPGFEKEMQELLNSSVAKDVTPKW